MDIFNTKKPELDYIYKLFKKLDIDIDMMTDPKLIEDVLTHDLYMDDFLPFISMLGDRVKTSRPLRPLLSNMTEGILTKRVPIKEFIYELINKDILEDLSESGKNKILRSIHLIYLLEILTHAMASDFDFSNKVRDFYDKKRKTFGISKNFIKSFLEVMKLTGSLFKSLKTKTMDHSFNMFKRIQEAGPGMISSKHLNERNRFMRLNIMEAVLTDFVTGKKNNAIAGLALIKKKPINQSKVSPEIYSVKTFSKKGWTTLYEGWNMAFVIGNLNNLDIILPKLLIPSVLNARDEDYQFNRAISLWITININLFAEINNRKVILPKAKEMGKIFGEINYKHAKNFLRMNESNAHIFSN